MTILRDIRNGVVTVWMAEWRGRIIKEFLLSVVFFGMAIYASMAGAWSFNVVTISFASGIFLGHALFDVFHALAWDNEKKSFAAYAKTRAEADWEAEKKKFDDYVKNRLPIEFQAMLNQSGFPDVIVTDISDDTITTQPTPKGKFDVN